MQNVERLNNAEIVAHLGEGARLNGIVDIRARTRQCTVGAADHLGIGVRRVIRALEVCIETGQPITELQRKDPPPYQIAVHGLTLDREELYAQADKRVDLMVEQGFVDEVRRLLAMGYSRTLPSMSGLGYREIAAYHAGEIALDTAISLTKNATHDFIRRQYTWFRKMGERVMWHNVRQVDIHDWAEALHRSL